MGSRRNPFTDKISLDLNDDRIQCCVSSKQSLRKSQEASLNCILNFDRKTSLFAVYDGHGGAVVADYASVKLPSMVKNEFYKSCEFQKALLKAYKDFDNSLLKPSVVDEMISVQKKFNETEAIGVESTSSSEVENTPKTDENKKTEKPIAENSEIDCGSSNSNHDDDERRKVNFSPFLLKEETEKAGKESGCTALMALLVKRKLYVANVGDSRCVISIDGKAYNMSKDHRPTDDFELKRICAAGGSVSSDGRLDGNFNFSRALGIHNYKMNADLLNSDQIITALPDVSFLDLKSVNADFIVLACDGIWSSLSSQEVVDFISERINKPNIKLSSICEELFDLCLSLQVFCEENKNMTCIIVKLNPKKKQSLTLEMDYFGEIFKNENSNTGLEVTHATSTKERQQSRSVEEENSGQHIKNENPNIGTEVNDAHEPVNEFTSGKAKGTCYVKLDKSVEDNINENFNTRPKVNHPFKPINEPTTEQRQQSRFMEMENVGQLIQDENPNTGSKISHAPEPINELTIEKIQQSRSIEIENSGEDIKNENFSTGPEVNYSSLPVYELVLGKTKRSLSLDNEYSDEGTNKKLNRGLEIDHILEVVNEHIPVKPIPSRFIELDNSCKDVKSENLATEFEANHAFGSIRETENICDPKPDLILETEPALQPTVENRASTATNSESSGASISSAAVQSPEAVLEIEAVCESKSIN